MVRLGLSSENYLKKVLTGKSVKKHLTASYCYLPEAWVFPPLLELTTKKRGGEGDTKIRKQITLYAPKTKMQWREFSFLHPNNYLHLVNLISNRKYIKALTKLSSGRKIFSYSIPVAFNNLEERTGVQIKQWVNLQNNLKYYNDKFPYLLIIDIQSCYHSMYTHLIEWSLKSLGKNYSDFGSQLDRSIRRGMENLTHGLPVGPRITDYVAELVLCFVDREIEVASVGVSYLGGRYRDNYFILCKSRGDAENLLKYISQVLRSKKLDINSSKTQILEANNYFNRDWRTDYILLRQQFGLEKFSGVKKLEKNILESLVISILRLSESVSNDRAIFEKSFKLFRRIRPLRKKDYLFYAKLVSRMYKVRTPSIPAVLLFLSILSEESLECKHYLDDFLSQRFQESKKLHDDFEMLWIMYFMEKAKFSREDVLFLKEKYNSTLIKLAFEYLESKKLRKLSKRDLTLSLWKGQKYKNTSKLKIVFSDFKGIRELENILSPKFIPS